MEVGASEYLAASVRLMSAVEGLSDDIRRPLEQLATIYFDRACRGMAPVIEGGTGESVPASEIDGERL